MDHIMSESNNHIIAKWTDRFLAWLIDFIIISSVSTSLIFVIFGTVGFEGDSVWAESTQYIPTSVLFFVYWTILEYKTGRTIGKKILNIKIISIEGKKPNLKGVLISSFGKAFLLPFDVLFGWILTNENRQRVFNRLGDTVVIKIKNTESSDVKFIKD